MKKFWRILKKILMVATGLCAAALFIVVLTSAIRKQNQLVCRNIQVKIDYDSGLAFLNENEITDRINYSAGGNIIGKPLAGLNLRALENETEKNPFVDKAEIFVDQRQDIIVEVVQKRPILRVINNDGVGYYLCEKNERIPLSDKFTSHVAIALGQVETHTGSQRDSTVQAALYNLMQFVRKDEFLLALVDQVYVQENGEMDIIPKTGGHTIHLGKVDGSMSEKFERLKIFYKEGLPIAGWTKYISIDLRFKDQVVCEKKDTVNNIK